MLINDNRQTWHDIIARTIVINRIDEESIINRVRDGYWEESKNFKRNRRIVVILTTLIVINTILNSLVNDVGLFGLKKIKAISFTNRCEKISFFDINNDGFDEIISIAPKDNELTLFVYEYRENNIYLTKEYYIDNLPLTEVNYPHFKFKVDDLDDDGHIEIILLRNREENNILTIFEEDGGVFREKDHVIDEINTISGDNKKPRIRSNSFISDFSIVEDKGKEIYWIYSTSTNPRIHSFAFEKDSLVERRFDIINKEGVFAKGDFNGDGNQELYLLEDKNEDINLYNIKNRDNKFELVEAGRISDWSKVNNSLENYDEIKIADFNGDGQDDIVLLTLSGRALRIMKGDDKDPWIKVCSQIKGKWKIIWSGGDSKAANLLSGSEYHGNLDIDGDGRDEIIITKQNYSVMGYDEHPVSILEIYDISPLKFLINRMWQTIWYF